MYVALSMVDVHLATQASLQASFQSNNGKQIIQIKHNLVKNPDWQEADQLAIFNRGRGVELGTTEKQLQLEAY